MYKKPFIIFLLVLLTAPALRAQFDLNHFYYQGRQALIDGKYSQAIDNFNILSRLDTARYEAFFFRGIAKYNLGDFTGAQMDFDRTIRLNPIYTPAYHYRAITLSRVGKYDLALKDLEEAVDLRPSYTGLYFSRGVTYFLSQQFERAISDFDRFIRKMPNEGDAYLNRGACYLFTGDTLRALQDYETAISKNRYDPEGYIRRSRIYGMQGRTDEAIEDLDTAIQLDSTNTFAYFNRALLRYDRKQVQEALSDLDRVLQDEPGNALTLYNRALIRMQVGDYANALEDLDRVLAINPDNVLAYFNRAALFTEMGRWRDAMDDYSKAINLYPDFAQAYMNRAYVKSLLGQYNSSRQDYQIAQSKISEYRERSADTSAAAAFADTSRRFNRLLALDADFAKKDFENELLQYRDVDIHLKPLYRFTAMDEVRRTNNLEALSRGYEDPAVDRFIASLPLPVRFDARAGNAQEGSSAASSTGSAATPRSAHELFAKALRDTRARQFNSAMLCYDEAITLEPGNPYYYINRAALQAEMIDFLSSMETHVQVLTLDDSHAARTRVQDRVSRQYDYTPALSDMSRAEELDPGSPYVQYNLGNLYCLSGDLPESIARYSRALDITPYIPEAYYNRGLVLIYLKDKDKGCIDLSVAGEMGIQEAYAVIKKYCKTED